MSCYGNNVNSKYVIGLRRGNELVGPIRRREGRLLPLRGDCDSVTLTCSCSLHYYYRVIKELIEPEAAVEHQATATHQLPEAPPSNPLSDKPSEFLSHNGPGLYVPPPAKSNKKLIKNAISYVCLAGDANLTLKQRALAVS